MSINKVIITGNLTRDIDMKVTQGGMAIGTLGVAVNDRRKNSQTGQWEDVANFVDCTLFGRRAEALAQYLVKGTKVAIEGKLRWQSWEDRSSGQKRSKLDVVVDDIELLGGKQGQTQQRQQPAPQADLYAASEVPF